MITQGFSFRKGFSMLIYPMDLTHQNERERKISSCLGIHAFIRRDKRNIFFLSRTKQRALVTNCFRSVSGNKKKGLHHLEDATHLFANFLQIFSSTNSKEIPQLFFANYSSTRASHNLNPTDHPVQSFCSFIYYIKTSLQ